MDWLRSKKLFRVLVAFLTATLLPMLVAPMPQANGHAVSDDYGEWLRGQVRTSVDEAFESALASASEAEPESLAEFLYAFVEAYEAMDPEGSLTDVLAVPQMSTDAVLAHLQKRLVTTRGVPLASPAALLTGKYFTTNNIGGFSASVLPGTTASTFHLELLGPVVETGAEIVTPVHVLFTAQPRGP